MAPKGFVENQVREAKNFIKENMKVSGSKSYRRASLRDEKDVQEVRKKRNSLMSNSSESSKISSSAKSSKITTSARAEDKELSTKNYISVSPKIFRKNAFQKNKLQRSIIVNTTGNKGINFDPSHERSAPIYLDIPNLYKPRKSQGSKLQKNVQRRYKYVGKILPSSEYEHGPRYKFLPRPTTPKNFNPRPKSGCRYVYIGSKNRYKVRSS